MLLKPKPQFFQRSYFSSSHIFQQSYFFNSHIFQWSYFSNDHIPTVIRKTHNACCPNPNHNKLGIFQQKPPSFIEPTQPHYDYSFISKTQPPTCSTQTKNPQKNSQVIINKLPYTHPTKTIRPTKSSNSSTTSQQLKKNIRPTKSRKPKQTQQKEWEKYLTERTTAPPP